MADATGLDLVELSSTAPFFGVHTGREAARRAAAERPETARFFATTGQEWQHDPVTGDATPIGRPDPRAVLTLALAVIEAANATIAADNAITRADAALHPDFYSMDGPPPERTPIRLTGAEDFPAVAAALGSWHDDLPPGRSRFRDTPTW